MKIPVEVDIHINLYIYIVYNYYVVHELTCPCRCVDFTLPFFSTVETLDFENIDILMIFACLSGPIILCYSGDLYHLSHHFEAQSTAHPLPRVQSTCHGWFGEKSVLKCGNKNMWEKTNKQKNEQTNKQANKQPSKQANKPTNKQTNKP